MHLVAPLILAAVLAAAAVPAYLWLGLDTSQVALAGGIAFAGCALGLLVPMPGARTGRGRATKAAPAAPAAPVVLGEDEMRQARIRVVRIRAAMGALRTERCAAPLLRIAEAASTGLDRIVPGKAAPAMSALVLARYLPEAVRVADAALAAESKGAPDPEAIHAIQQALSQLEKVFFRFADGADDPKRPLARREVDAALKAVDAKGTRA